MEAVSRSLGQARKNSLTIVAVGIMAAICLLISGLAIAPEKAFAYEDSANIWVDSSGKWYSGSSITLTQSKQTATYTQRTVLGKTKKQTKTYYATWVIYVDGKKKGTMTGASKTISLPNSGHHTVSIKCDGTATARKAPYKKGWTLNKPEHNWFNIKSFKNCKQCWNYRH